MRTDATMDTSTHRLLHAIDCTRDYPEDQFFSHGATAVTRTSAGAYREAEPKPMARFGYRFAIEHVGKPHVAIIRYPDDKRRHMCIMDGTTYDLTTGVFTGLEQPLSGEMQELRQVFWPRWKDCSIVFMTWGEGEPAAASAVEIWELRELPALLPPVGASDGPRRELGIQYEDPCGTGAAEGATNREEWLDRVVQYSRHTGQGLFVHPMAWYHGPLFPSNCEPAGALDTVTARDRKTYMRWTTQPEDWYAPMLEKFGEEGLQFQGSLTLMRLGSLMEKMNIDLGFIKAGADTINNMLWNDNVQESTMDWTTTYNVRNFNSALEALKDVKSIRGGQLRELAYGEKVNRAYHTGPIFNPLHPVVQEAILRFVREIGERYARFPAFKGISFNMFASAMPWFGSIHSGYDDYSVRLFEHETKISVPVDTEAPDRFSRRNEFLTYVCREAWVNWRCRKIRELFGTIRQTLAAARDDLRVTVTLWDETVFPNVLGDISASHQLYARQAKLELYRSAGIDMALYRDEPGLEVDLAIGNPRDRGGHGSSETGGAKLPPEEISMYRDFDFLDQESLDACHAHDRPGAFIFNCWTEAWGKHTWFLPEPDDPNLAQVTDMDGKPAEGVMRTNCEYPEDGFWWDTQMRITPPFPSGVHFLEPYAHAVAELDACRITRGGLFLDKAHSEEIRQFALAYRALPRRKFVTVGGSTDPVAVRTLCGDARRHFYAVNRDYYPVTVLITFNRDPSDLRDLATGESVKASRRWRLALGPYQLRSFAVAPDAEIVEFAATPPENVAKVLAEEAECAFRAFEDARRRGLCIPGMDEFETRMRAALAEGRLAWLRRALTSYITRKCLEEQRNKNA